MDFSKRVVDGDGWAQRTRFAAPNADIAALAQQRTLRRGVAMNPPKAKDLASWENEGGATAPAANLLQVARPAWAAGAAKYQDFFEDAPRGVDKGASATHMLTALRISLLLLVPAIGSGAVYWGHLVGGAPR
jgi:hypothetical protein